MGSPRKTILVVDDDPFLGNAVAECLGGDRIEVVSAVTAADARRLCCARTFDVVLLDQRLPDADGAELCPAILGHNEDVKIVFITGYPSYENAVTAVRAGAFDYLPKPFGPDELKLVLSRALRTLDLERVAALDEFEREREIAGAVLVGADGGLVEVHAQIRAAAVVSAPVLITGETGTGKNVAARCIHFGGPNPRAPMITVNCAALPESLIEAELFGHERGAFTGAHAARKGIFEMAEGGTLLLDEIGEIPSHLQAKLLGVLDDRTIKRLGSDAIRPIDVRIMASTSVDLEDAVAARRFRGDLYYRLSVVRIRIPPLRERREDIPELCRHCIAELAAGRRVRLPEAEINRLAAYDWPGNVRELRNVLERAIILGTGEVIEPSKLLEERHARARPAERTATAGTTDPPPLSLSEVERRHLESALRWSGGNRAQAARAVGISLSTLKRRLRDFGIE
jgi:DNA-binding NtrC family response regulator